VNSVGPEIQPRKDEAIVLGLLDAVDRDASVTQRSVARELGIALGLANAYLKRCVRKGLIKVNQVPTRRYAYYLTPKGLVEKSRLTATYLAHSLSFFRQARVECANLYAIAAQRGQVRLALIGHGDLAEIARLVAQDHPVEIVGVIPATREARRLADESRALGKVDAFVLTCTEYPQEVFAAAVGAFGSEGVHVPPLLRVRLPSTQVLAAEGRQ
jgi:predicted transcriptional regulator